ncbi:MAG: hypothetical protein IKR59_09905 [Lachnospiraceae bacterium]|nr:hypothetical protein [Lachnospiraceae bacterium]
MKVVEKMIPAEYIEKLKENKKTATIILAVIGGLVVAAGIAYLVYRILKPFDADDLEDDDFEDEEDFFETEE